MAVRPRVQTDRVRFEQRVLWLGPLRERCSWRGEEWRWAAAEGADADRMKKDLANGTSALVSAELDTRVTEPKHNGECGPVLRGSGIRNRRGLVTGVCSCRWDKAGSKYGGRSIAVAVEILEVWNVQAWRTRAAYVIEACAAGSVTVRR
jgi:hypothetical protein